MDEPVSLEAPRGRLDSVTWVVYLFAIVAGAASGWVMDQNRDRFYVAPPVVDNPSEAQAAAYAYAKDKAMRYGIAVPCGLAGCILAAAFGVWTGYARRSIAATLVGFSAAVGLGLPFIGWISGYSYDYGVNSATGRGGISVWRSMLLSLYFWGPVGLTSGIAILAGSLKPRRYWPTAVGVVLGGIIASAIVPMVCSLVFPATFKDILPYLERNQCWVGCVTGACTMALFVQLLGIRPAPVTKIP